MTKPLKEIGVTMYCQFCYDEEFRQVQFVGAEKQINDEAIEHIVFTPEERRELVRRVCALTFDQTDDVKFDTADESVFQNWVEQFIKEQGLWT